MQLDPNDDTIDLLPSLLKNLNQFWQSGISAFEVTENKQRELGTKVEALAHHLAEDTKTLKGSGLKDTLSHIEAFVTNLRNAVEDNKKARQLQIKRQQKAKMKAAAALAGKASSP